MQIQVLKTKRDKEEFLENDLIDRLVKIEQKVSSKFGKFITYKDTYCYKNLTPKNKERYEKFLKNKKKKKFAFASIFLLPVLGIFFLSNNLTGNVIAEQTGTNIRSLQMLLLGFLLGAAFFFAVYSLAKYSHKKRIDPLFEPLEKIKRKAYK